MGKLPRKTLKRLWYAGLLVLWLLPFALASIAQADNASPRVAGQGWAWKNRPPHALPETQPVPGTGVGGDIYCYDAPASPCSTQWRNEHIYVGWDGQVPEPEAIGGITFDVSSSVPSGSTIIRFSFKIKQHPSGADHNNTPNHTQPAIHGIVACPWPESDFLSGGTEGPTFLNKTEEDQRKCADSISGVPSETDAADLANPNKTFDWTFDVSNIASDWASGGTPAISIEPDRSLQSPISWMTSFHYDTVLHYPTGHSKESEVDSDDPDVGVNYVPGIVAEVTYLLPTGEEETGLVSGEFTTEFDSGSDALAFGDTEGLAGDLGASSESTDVQDPQQPRLAAGVFEGNPAGFWAYPLAWIAAILGFVLLGFAGRVLQVDPGQGRAPGAAAALMRGPAQSG